MKRIKSFLRLIASIIITALVYWPASAIIEKFNLPSLPSTGIGILLFLVTFIIVLVSIGYAFINKGIKCSN